MDIKRKYLLLNRIMIIFAVLSGYLAGSEREGDKISVCMWIIVFMTIFIAALDYQKRKEIRRKFGILKVIDDDHWLDMDGLRHAEYTEVLNSKLEKYYANGGESFGHCFDAFGRGAYIFISAVTCSLIMFVMGENSIDLSSLTLPPAILISVYWFYVLIRKVIIG